MDQCAVIIVNYNTGSMLQRVIEKVLKNERAHSVLIIDNDSQDNSMNFKTYDARVSKHYRNHNPGFANSCNFGAALSESHYLLFLNPDCLIPSQCISNLIDTCKQDSNTAIVGCCINNPDHSEQRASRRRLPTLSRAFKSYTGLEKFAKYCQCFIGVNLNHLPMPKNPQKVEAISGALIFIRKDVFEQINGFDNDFPLHFEDLDLFKRTVDQGYSIVLNPTISAIHYQGLSSQSNPKVQQLKRVGLQRYFDKHAGFFSRSIIKLISRLL